MSFPTEPCFSHYGTWDEETRSHPAMKFMEDYALNHVDKQNWDAPHSDHHTDDYTFFKGDGTEVQGGKEGWAAIAAFYAPFTSHFHEPYFIVCATKDYGYEMIGQAWLFGNFPGEPTPGEQKVKDSNGKEWDTKISGAFRFEFVRDSEPKGFRIRRTEIMSDTGPSVVTLLKRGVLKTSDLGL